MKKSISPRFTFLLILAIFVVPLAIAWLMHSGVAGLVPESSRNEGYLVQPPVHIDWSQAKPVFPPSVSRTLEGHWVVLHEIPSDCALSCLERVTELRQVHRASGRDQHRILIALLFDTAPPLAVTETLNNIYPEFNLLGPAEVTFRDALATVPEAAGNVDFYLIDPRGDIMMTYNEFDSAAKLSKDLKTLLTWSGLDRR